MTTPTVTVVLVTDPLHDDEAAGIVTALVGCRRLEGSPGGDGTPVRSRSVFELVDSDLWSGGLEQRIDRLATFGIHVHRVLGDHPAVMRANRRLGWS